MITVNRFFSVAMLVCLTVLSTYADDEYKSYLTDRAKETYELVEYNDLNQAPKTFRRKNLKLEIPFRENASYIPYLYSKTMPTNRYYYFSHPGERYSQRDVPIILNRTSKRKIVKYLLDIESGSDIVIYGQLKKASGRKKKTYGDSCSEYYFYVDDVDGGGELAEGDDSQKVKDDDYQKVDPKNLDLLADNYIGKKIRLPFCYCGRTADIDWALKRKFENDKYFQLESGRMTQHSDRSYPLKGFNLIGRKRNSVLVEAMLKLKDEDKITLFGELDKYTDSRYSPPKTSYYILLDKITPLTAASSK